MAYASTNFKTKKALREAVARGEKVSVYQPGPMAGVAPIPSDGSASVEGPWSPEPHKWYAKVTLKDGFIVSVK